MKNGSTNDQGRFDLSALLQPANAFAHPDDIVGDPDLTLNEKRAILSSWASDVCACEAMPELREQSSRRRVTFEDIADALRALDAAELQPLKKYQKLVRRRRILSGNHRKSEGNGSSAR